MRGPAEDLASLFNTIWTTVEQNPECPLNPPDETGRSDSPLCRHFLSDSSDAVIRFLSDPSDAVIHFLSELKSQVLRVFGSHQNISNKPRGFKKLHLYYETFNLKWQKKNTIYSDFYKNKLNIWHQLRTGGILEKEPFGPIGLFYRFDVLLKPWKKRRLFYCERTGFSDLFTLVLTRSQTWWMINLKLRTDISNYEQILPTSEPSGSVSTGNSAVH